MGCCQSGVTAEANASALFLTFNQSHAADALQTIRQALSQVPALEAEFRQQYPNENLHLVAAIGSCFWSKISEQSPALLAPFPALENGALVAPSTPVDLLFHIRSEAQDINFLLAHRLREMLGSAVQRIEEVPCFRYRDARDLTGFVDGTENPQGEDRFAVAVVGDEDAAFAGGSYIHLQRYIHNLTRWSRESVKAQEDTYGRTKQDNVEYASADKPLTAHTKRTSLKDAEGQSIEILRHSLPYGDSEESGLLFASYCRTPENFTLMLKSMVEGDGAGHSDRLLQFTRAVTGSAFFAPSVEFLESLG